MIDRFDFEQNILRCWNITDDINTLYKRVMDDDISKDDIANVLCGIITLYNLKFDETFKQNRF
jgi:hypothetical protein